MSTPSERNMRHVAVPFSRPLDVEHLPDGGAAQTISASPAECVAVAAEVGLPAISSLTATFRVEGRPGRRVEVRGDVVADITQTCVVSLEPFESRVTQAIELTFVHVKPLHPKAAHARPSQGNPAHSKTMPDRDFKGRRDRGSYVDDAVAVPVALDGEADPPDPIVDGRIDLGAIATEFLVLCLDPYPKKPGVHFNDVVIGDTDEPEPSAFAALARIKDRS